MLMIRFTKTGRRGERKYRIVVKEKRSKRDGAAVDYLGWYEKKVDGVTKQIDEKRLKYWVEHGAQMSNAIRALVEGK